MNNYLLSFEIISLIYFLMIFIYIKLHFFCILCLNKSIRNIIYTLCYQSNKGNDEKKKKKRHIHINSFETHKEKRNAKNIVFFYKHTQTHIVFFLHLRCYVFFARIIEEKKTPTILYFFLSFGNRIDVLMI